MCLYENECDLCVCVFGCCLCVLLFFEARRFVDVIRRRDECLRE